VTRIISGRRRGPRRGPAAWVLGGGAARGAAQVGTLRALFEHGFAPPSAIFGSSVGALDGAVIAARPDVTGVDILERLWLSETAREVFRVRSLGVARATLGRQPAMLSPVPIEKLILQFEVVTRCRDFADLRLPLRVVATDLLDGSEVVVRSGPLLPALLASTSIPGIFPPVMLDGRMCSDGGIVDNVPIAQAVNEGYGKILAIGLMAPGPLADPPSSWTQVIARTLQLSLHHRLLSDFKSLEGSARIVVLCPTTSAGAAWDMRRPHTEALIDRAHFVAARFLREAGDSLFDRSAIHYLDLEANHGATSRTEWLSRAG
jgi:NTE family protein